MKSIVLNKNISRRVEQGHPWIFSNEVNSGKEKDTAAKRTHEIQRMLNNSKALGYCQRDSSLLGVDTPERFGAISVPVFSGNQLIACLSCSWLPAVETESSIVQKYLPLLREAAKVIGSRAHESNLSSLPA